MMSHEECLEYLENCVLRIDHFTEYYLLDYYNGAYHAEKIDKSGDSQWVKLPYYVGDAFVNWFVELENEDS
jgi:hypothetical protein